MCRNNPTSTRESSEENPAVTAPIENEITEHFPSQRAL